MKTRKERLAPLKERLLTSALASSEFKNELKAAADAIVRGSLSSANEATVAGLFERVIYAVLLDIDVEFSPDKEVLMNNTIRHTGKGRADSRIGATVIEYKYRTKLNNKNDIDAAITQLSDYVVALSRDLERESIGFLTDGIQIYELRAYDGIVTSISGKFDIDDKSLLKLIRCIISLRQSALNSANLIKDFCGDIFDGVLFDVARMLFGILNDRATIKTNMLRSEWEELFRLAHDDLSQQKRIQERGEKLSEIFRDRLLDAASEYRALFSLHTAYAIILKLIAFRVVSDIQFGSRLRDYKSLTKSKSEILRPFCSELEDGEIFRKLGILNLLEGDFFSWYCDDDQWSEELANALRQILAILSRYEDVSTVFSSVDAIQLFRELYEATVPQIVRASFGEFNTPYWLAQHVFQSSILEDNWRALDPCCGSGTFVIAAISQIRRDKRGSPPNVILEEILARVSAIDLNPLAVLTTRIHYFIHIADLLPTNMENLVIPVYLGDSSYIPEKVLVSNVECLKYQLHTHTSPIDIVIPTSLIEDTANFAQIMYKYERLVKRKKLTEASGILIESIVEKERNQQVIDLIVNLTQQLVILEKDKRNGIWARIITNFLTTGCLKPFTNIIGNPPWIDWKNLPSNYRDKIKSICIEKGLFSGAGRTGGINLNICALITHVSCHWLSEKGHLAFLLPRELAYQSSYEGWLRSVGGDNREILGFYDWSKAGHPFYPVTEDFMTFVLGPKVKRQQPKIIPASHFVKKPTCRTKANAWKSVEEAMSNLILCDGVAGQITPKYSFFTFAKDKDELLNFSKIAGECAYVGREGIEFYPQELLIFKYVAPGPLPGTVFVRNAQFTKSKYRIPDQKILLESKFLFPLIRGRNIDRFVYTDEDFFVPFPYKEESPNRPIDFDTLESESQLLLNYYERNKQVIMNQTGFSDKIRGPDAGEYYGLARTGPYSFRDVYVSFRDNTKWRATVVTKKLTPWGENKRFLFQNHAVSICEKQDGSGFISIDEANYICAILNAKIVENYLYASSDYRSFRIRPPIYLPKYDKNNIKHKKLSSLSRLAVTGIDIDEIREQIDDVYLYICSNRER